MFIIILEFSRHPQKIEHNKLHLFTLDHIFFLSICHLLSQIINQIYPKPIGNHYLLNIPDLQYLMPSLDLIIIIFAFLLLI